MAKTTTKLYRFALLKSYFDAGYGTSSYIKYMIGFFGISNSILTQNIKLLMILGFSYGIFCWVLGWAMYNIPTKEHNYILSQQEVNNQFDYFAKEVRHRLKGKLFK